MAELNILDKLRKKLLNKNVPKVKIREPINLAAKALSKNLLDDVLQNLVFLYGEAKLKQYRETSVSINIVFEIPDIFRVQEARKIRGVLIKHFVKTGFSSVVKPVVSSGNIIGYNVILKNKGMIKFFFKLNDKINRGYITEGLLALALYVKLLNKGQLNEALITQFTEKIKTPKTEFRNEFTLNDSKIELYIKIPQQSFEILFSNKLKDIMGDVSTSIIEFVNKTYDTLPTLILNIPQTFKILNVGTKGDKADILLDSTSEDVNLALKNNKKLSIKAGSAQVGQKRVGYNPENIKKYLESIFNFSVNVDINSFTKSNTILEYKELFNKIFYQVAIDFEQRKDNKKYLFHFLKTIEEQVSAKEANLSFVSFSSNKQYTHLNFDNFAKDNYKNIELFSKIRYGDNQKWPILYIFLNKNKKTLPMVSIRSRMDKSQGIRIYLEFQKGIHELF